MYNEDILNNFLNHFELVKYVHVLQDKNENEINQIHMSFCILNFFEEIDEKKKILILSKYLRSLINFIF